MPPVIAFVAAIGTAAAGLVGIAVVGGAAFAVGAAIIVGGTMLVTKLAKPGINQGIKDNDRSRQVTARGTIESQKIIYGEALVSGPLSFVGVSGSGNKKLHHVVALAGHPVEAITEIWLDDQIITAANIAGDNWVESGTFAPLGGEDIVKIVKNLGTSTQVADTDLVAGFTGYTSDHRGRGIANIATTFVLNNSSQELWDKYAPNNIKALVQGRNEVYDPRLDSTVGESPTSATYQAYTDNPALCVVDYLVNARFGMGIAVSKIDWAAVVTAADACDQTVAIPTSATQKRFTANGVLFATDKHQININKLLSSMNGTLIYTGGIYVVRAGIYEAPTESLDEDDLIGPITVKTSVERSERFNTCGGIFIDPAQQHKSMEFPKVQLTAALNRDNGEVLEREIDLPFTNSSYMAQRIANKLVQLSDQQKIVSFPCNLSGLRVAVGDRVNLTVEDFGWTNKVFRCMAWAFSDNGGVDLTLVEDDSGSYADPAEGAYSTVTSTGVIVDGFPGVPDPQNLAAAAGIKSIDLNWTNPENVSKFAGVILYASETSAWGAAVEIGRGMLTSFKHDASTTADPITNGDERWYWVRAIGTGSSGQVLSDRNPDNDTSTITATAALNQAQAVEWAAVADGAGNRPDNNADVTGENTFVPAVSWPFAASSLDGFSATNNSTLVSQNNGTVRLSATGLDPILESPSGLTVVGADNFIIRARVWRISGSTWDGKLFYSTAGHAFSGSYYKDHSDTTTTGQWVIMEWDMSSLTIGGTDWIDNTILQIRLDLGFGSGDDFLIDWVTIGRKSGTSAPGNADVTGLNTSLNTTNVGGTAAATVESGAASGATASQATGVANGAQVNTIDAGDGLAALDSTANNKLSGIATGATINISTTGTAFPAGGNTGDFYHRTGSTAPGIYLKILGAWILTAIDPTGDLIGKINGIAVATVTAGASLGGTSSQATGVANNADVTGENTFVPAVSWPFAASSLDGFLTANATLVSQNNGTVRLDSTGSDPILASPSGLTVVGADNFIVRARVQRVAGSAWDGSLYYSTAGHGETGSYYKAHTDTTVTGQWIVVEWDMSALTVGGTDWIDNTILQIRLDLGASASDDFLIDWITIGRKSSIATIPTALGDVIESLSQNLLPNWNFSIVDSEGKPAGIKSTEGITSRSQVQFGGIGIQILGTPDSTVAYGFPAIPIDDAQVYSVTIRHKSSAADADGLYLRFEELNSALPNGKTHVGTADGSSVSATRTGVVDLVSNGPMPGTSTVENTYAYTPTAGTKYASFSMYNWSGFAGTYEVEFVQITSAFSGDIGAHGHTAQGSPGGKVWNANGSGVWQSGNPTFDLVAELSNADGTLVASRTLRGTMTTSTGNISVTAVSSTADAGYSTAYATTANASKFPLATVTFTMPSGKKVTQLLSWIAIDPSTAGGLPVTGGGK